ncbi:hypothetical protein SAAV_2515 [Staphylococcus aureus subsp. aureus ED98]|nr:hypothetical protein SAAV_2515 [Staphylococcus aureus subsp. aureus ED98]
MTRNNQWLMLLVVFLGVSVMGNTLTLEFRYRLGSRKC